jgi:putative ubiquitin-RnfH superfamily antitoxin RatB of RatAB toxin-antitoxin module
MENVDLTINIIDLKVLYLITEAAYVFNICFKCWCLTVEDDYLDFISNTEKTQKTFSQYVNDRIEILKPSLNDPKRENK